MSKNRKAMLNDLTETLIGSFFYHSITQKSKCPTFCSFLYFFRGKGAGSYAVWKEEFIRNLFIDIKEHTKNWISLEEEEKQTYII